MYIQLSDTVGTKQLQEMILTLGGLDVNREILNSTEITNPSGKGNLLCSSIPTQLPITLQKSIGALIDGRTIIICGGEYEELKTTEKCYILTDNGFKNLVNMTTKRSMASSIVTKDNKLWVTGGSQDSSWSGLKSTEVIDFKSLTSTRYVDLPDYMWGHKMVAINESTSILIGGVYDKSIGWSKKTYFFDFLNGIWTPGPSLKFARNQHSAELMTSNQGQPVLVVVGGFNREYSSYLSSVEILRDPSINGQWEYGNVFTPFYLYFTH